MIKGPNLQHRLNVLRLWRCPKCSRTVRTRGSVTTRLCRCGDRPTLMQIVEEPRYPKFDPTPFVTYDNKQDSTPTAAELVEELPEREITQIEIAAAEKAGKPRRGKGYLRAEIDESATDAEPKGGEPEAEFGAGIADDQPGDSSDKATAAPETFQITSSPAAAASDPAVPSAPASHTDPGESGSPEDESGASKSRSRRRRRPRRRGRDRQKNNEGAAADEGPVSNGGDFTDESLGSAAADTVPLPQAAGESTGDQGPDGDNEKKDGKRRRRPRRRNRRRRGKGGSGPSTGQPPSGSST